MDVLEEMAREAYDRTIGLDLADVWPSIAASRRPHAVARRQEKARWIGESGASNAR
jgi:aconitase A